MNYIDLINNFWELDEQWQFTCCETRLYFYLVKTANRLGWVDNWTHSDAKAAANVGVSENSLKTARNKLIQSGLIEFKAGGKFRGDKNRYQILIPYQHPKPTPNHDPYQHPKPTPLYKHKQNKTIIPPNPQGGTDDVEIVEDGLNFKGNENNIGQEKRKKVAQKKEIDLPFVADDFKPIVKRWLDYKASKGQTYKNADSLQTMYRKLLKCSGNNLQSAVEVIEDAMAKNYSGFFELKNSSTNEQQHAPTKPTFANANERSYGSMQGAKQNWFSGIGDAQREFEQGLAALGETVAGATKT